MREINKKDGRVYAKDDHYFLEKIYDDLLDLIEEEKLIKRRAKKGGFKLVKYNWYVKDNERYKIEQIINSGKCENEQPVKFVLKLKLKYK